VGGRGGGRCRGGEEKRRGERLVGVVWGRWGGGRDEGSKEGGMEGEGGVGGKGGERGGEEGARWRKRVRGGGRRAWGSGGGGGGGRGSIGSRWG